MRMQASGEFRPNRRVRARTAGFTLIELLTMMAVIGILATLLSTALNTTRSKARQITCLGSMRQLQVAWFMYADEENDRLTLNQSVASGNERIFGRRNSTNSWVAGNPKEDVTPDNIMAGTLYPYVKTVAAYHCPADKSTVPGQRDFPRTRSYSMSAYMNGDRAGVDSRVKSRYADLASSPPDKVFVFIEENDASVWAGAFEVAAKDRFSLTSGSWTSTPADWHNRGCNLSFADGHVERWRWYWPKGANLNNKMTINKEEFLDLRRLQDCIPKP